MKCHRALLGTLTVLAMAIAPACRNTAEGVKEDSRENAEKAKEGSEKAADETKDAAGKMSDEAAQAGEKIGDAAKDAGHAIKEGAKDVAAEVDAKKQTVDVKTALMADKGVDASHIDVDTDASTKTVTLKGSVPSQAQKVKADQIAHDYAAGYRIVNQLTVSGKPSRPPS